MSQVQHVGISVKNLIHLCKVARTRCILAEISHSTGYIFASRSHKNDGLILQVCAWLLRPDLRHPAAYRMLSIWSRLEIKKTPTKTDLDWPHERFASHAPLAWLVLHPSSRRRSSGVAPCRGLLPWPLCHGSPAMALFAVWTGPRHIALRVERHCASGSAFSIGTSEYIKFGVILSTKV